MLTFQEAITESEHYPNRHLLLGNGFSIACRPNIFAYGQLYEEANFTGLSPYVKAVFEALSTQDFERVIKALRDAYAVIKVYSDDANLIGTLKADADSLRELLVQTIAS